MPRFRGHAAVLPQRSTHAIAAGLVAAVLTLAAPGTGSAQSAVGSSAAVRSIATADTVSLQLEDAVRLALGRSEEVGLARSRVDEAEAEVRSARAAAFPQINSSFNYARTFDSPFNSGVSISVPDSLRFEPDTTLPLPERVRYLERQVPSAGLGGLAQSFGSLPFGQENAYTASLSGSQILYSGGRVGAALRIAGHVRQGAALNLREELAEIELQVRTAYYQALLAQELEAIAVVALDQAEAFLRDERLRLDAGRASELEVLRAEVSRDNLRPQLVEARNAAELATLNLKRLTDVPLDQPVRLTTRLDVPPAPVLADTTPASAVRLAQRAALLAAEEQVRIREQQVRIAKSAFLPDVSLQMNYGKQLFPQNALSLSGDWRTDWTANVGVRLPIFNGFQRAADVQRARVQTRQAELQLAQLRDATQLQYEQAKGEKARARSAIAARNTTVSAAQRVYDLTVLRYDEGLATQLEVSQARLELLQARTNLAQAISDFHIADAGLTRSLGGSDAAALPGLPDAPDQPATRTPAGPPGGAS